MFLVNKLKKKIPLNLQDKNMTAKCIGGLNLSSLFSRYLRATIHWHDGKKHLCLMFSVVMYIISVNVCKHSHRLPAWVVVSAKATIPLVCCHGQCPCYKPWNKNQFQRFVVLAWWKVVKRWERLRFPVLQNPICIQCALAYPRSSQDRGPALVYPVNFTFPDTTTVRENG